MISRKDPSVYILKPYYPPYLATTASIVVATLFILAYKYRRWVLSQLKAN